MKKNYATPVVTSHGDAVCNTKAATGLPEPSSGNGVIESVGSVGFNL